MKRLLILETFAGKTKYQTAECAEDDTGFHVTSTGVVQGLDHLEELQDAAGEVWETASLNLYSNMRRVKP